MFSDVEILEIHQKIDNEQESNTISDAPSINKQELPNRNELPTSENRDATLPNNAVNTNTRTKGKSIKFKVNYERGKDYLTITKGIELRTVKMETKKINQVLPYLSMNNITELNELIYAGAKLVCEKIGIPSKSTKKKSKPGWGIRLETQIKNLRKQAKMIRKRKDAVTC